LLTSSSDCSIRVLAEDSSEARTTFLIRLYDELRDIDLKATVLRELARRDHQSAAQKVLAVAKSDREEADLRERAIRELAEDSGEATTTLLIELYDTITDSDLKETVIRQLADRNDAKSEQQLQAIVKSEPDRDLRATAIRHLIRR